MTALREEDMHVHLTVDDTRTAQLAGCKFARTLAGVHSEDFALALAEQEHLVERAITNAGFNVEQARPAAGLSHPLIFIVGIQ